MFYFCQFLRRNIMPKKGYKQTEKHKRKIGSILKGRKIDPYIAKRKKLAWDKANPEKVAKRKADAEAKRKAKIKRARIKAGKKGAETLKLRREGEAKRIEALNKKLLPQTYGQDIIN